MARQLDGKIAEVLKKYEFGKDACWDCHGTWVVYHRVLESIAAKAGIKFESPYPLEAKGTEKCVAICVTGTMADKTEWSIGEAAPGNNKNSYPYAMAEKRAKDRVVLKLIGLHGLVYSEEEADDFTPPKKVFTGPLTKTKLEDKLRQFVAELQNVSDLGELAGLQEAYSAEIKQCKDEHAVWWFGNKDSVGLKDRILGAHETLQLTEGTPLDGG